MVNKFNSENSETLDLTNEIIIPSILTAVASGNEQEKE